MSFQYSLYKASVRFDGTKKRMSGSAESLTALSRQKQKEYRFSCPQDDMSHRYVNHVLEDRNCIHISSKGKKNERALLYLCGGRMLMPPEDSWLQYAQQIADRTDREVWFFHYPLCAENSMKDAVVLTHRLYGKMLEFYKPENIAFYGFSSGAFLALCTMLYNNTLSAKLPACSKMILISPSGIWGSEEEKEKMLAMKDRDILTDPASLETMRDILDHGEKIPEFMLSGYGADYRGLPETWMFFGSEECFSAKAEFYEKAYAKGKSRCHVRTRQDMCGCYCITVRFPEAQEDYDTVINILKQ